MDYCSFITDLIITVSVNFYRLTLAVKNNRTSFYLVILLFLVEIIINILDDHGMYVRSVAFLFLGRKRILFIVRRNYKLPIGLTQVFLSMLVVVIMMAVLRLAAMVAMTVSVLTGQDSIDEEDHHVTNEEK